MKLFLKQAVGSYKCLGFHCENIWHSHSNNSLFIRNFKHFMAGASNSNFDNVNEKPFLPKKALILTKFSRYEFEKRRHADLSEEELIKNDQCPLLEYLNSQFPVMDTHLEERGSDYNNLLQHHEIHMKNRELVVKTLQENGIETKVVNRFDYSDASIEWADVVLTTGGDGTFLMAASKIRNKNKPLIGINSDPSRSLGYLCLPSFYTENFPEAIHKLQCGNFRWMCRQRIKVTLTGEHAFDQPVELHDQQLQYPEYRFLDCDEIHHKKTSPKVPKLARKRTHELPVRALNEVFIGESLSSRVSYYEFSIDSEPKEKIKSSGLTVCTGTGSTSWSFNINKVTEQCVKHLLKITSQEANVDIPFSNSDLVSQITSRFNNSLIFDPTKQLMAYTIRDPIVFGMGFKMRPRGFAQRIEVKSRMFDACLVIDGGLSFTFNDGSTALLEINDEDSLLTIKLPE